MSHPLALTPAERVALLGAGAMARRPDAAPTCARAGCEDPCFHYCEATGYEERGFARLCPRHLEEERKARRDHQRAKYGVPPNRLRV